ncbi:MAG: tRNA epoxyqueuosine(34) reductase QueG [Chlorobi bacterium]|nr:tRNA epoxyqueuosine(34) reductase QueG [Chlorobiota bacterium]MBX7215552.1 tRNA epoxyqueuosine(34) reductase QueG [Candidatus Kapabacteria bacterium]
MPMPATNHTEAIRHFITSTLGFDLAGIAAAERMDREADLFEEWLAHGHHGTMEWIARNNHKRRDVRQILPSARSVIVVARNYYTPFHHAANPDHAKISRYAWGRDYHNILPKKLKQLHQFIQTLEPNAESRWYVDTGPILEKQWAARAGLGWMGKHTNIINRKMGSWLFLGVLISSLELEYDSPIGDFCGSCTRCLDACPTNAFPQPYLLDATRCISYVTIEQLPKEEIPKEYGQQMENWVFGCDICQEVCPWNRFQTPTSEPDFHPRTGVMDLTVEQVQAMSDEEFQERFQGSPVRRAKADGFRRNGRGVG